MHARVPIPGPSTSEWPGRCQEQFVEETASSTLPQFQSALGLVREVIGTERRLTLELVQSYERVRQWREKWGYSPKAYDILDSPPAYSPPQDCPSISSQSPDRSLSPIPVSIPNPPIPGEASLSVELLFDQVNAFAKRHGFGIVRRNAYSYKGRKIRYSFQCDRYGEPGPSQGAGLRQRKSRKCGCKWMVIAEALQEGRWLLRQHSNPDHGQHNHGSSIAASAHPSHRKLTGPYKATVESASRRVGIRARDVRAIVQQQLPESSLTRKDIYNARVRINRDNLKGYSPTAALIKLFDEEGIPYLVKWANDEPNRLLGLFWTFPYCLRMWKRLPEVISFDNTYNTNRFKLPLFQATGQTAIVSVSNAAFDLIDNERREGFQFLVESIKELADQHSIRQPDVIITDFDKQMKAALDDQFPDIQQQLCIHHINSSVLLKAKQKWTNANGSSSDGSDTEASTAPIQEHSTRHDVDEYQMPISDVIPHSHHGVLAMWKHVAFAETEKAHEEAWVRLCKKFNDQRSILQYLHATYMPVRAQWARCFIRTHRNFGIRVTSGTESSNNNVKSYLLNGMSHLYRLVEAMQDMVRDQERDFTDACATDEVLAAREYVGPSSEYLGELRMALSSKALGLITKQYRTARKAMPTGENPFPKPLGECNQDCSVSVELGIPCCHTIYSKLASGVPFTKRDVHPRWRLREPSTQNPYRRILDPKIATNLRGRPKNTAELVPERLCYMTIGCQSSTRPTAKQVQQVSKSRRGGRQGDQNISIGFDPDLDRSKKASKSQSKNSRGSMSTQRLTHSQSAIMGAGKTTEVRASGRQTRPSIRRRKSQWEMLESDEEVVSSIIVRP